MKFILLIVSLLIISQTKAQSDCDHRLPEGWTFLYNNNTGEYVIRTMLFQDIYNAEYFLGHNGQTIYKDMPIRFAMRAKDTCTLKTNVIQFFIQQKKDEERECKLLEIERQQRVKDSINNDFRPIK